MNLRMREHSIFNIWPSFTDVAIAMLLIFIFFIFIQFIANSKALVQIRIEKKQKVMEKALQKKFPDEMAAKEIRIIPDGNLQRITFSDYILFDSGQAVLKPRGKVILRQVGRHFLQNRYNIKQATRRELYNEIHIDGHTDNVPINTEQFPSNWELSSARAMAVVRFFHDAIHISPSLLSATGYGEYQAVAPNTETERRKNRRIEIILVYSEKE